MKYQDSGVIYDLMDPFKRAAQLAARQTAGNLTAHGFSELEWTRGESVYVVRKGSMCIGFVVEGLGTKNLAIERMREQGKIFCTMVGQRQGGISKEVIKQFSANVAIDNAAMVFNDMATLGIRPVVFGQHLAVGASDWFMDEERWQGYIDGTVNACNEVRCSWGCGETPTLKGIIDPQAAELSGASWGTCSTNELITCNIQDGDRIILVPSTGVHANGLTLCRQIAENESSNYYASMDDGKMFGEGLLQPTALYGPFVESCQKYGAEIHYAVNITGHGWRKLMRAIEPFAYIVEHLPEPQPVFRFIQKHGNVSTRDMYADYNMGAGFALYVPKSSVTQVTVAATEHNLDVLDAGYIEKRGDLKIVDIEPIDQTYGSEDLAVR